MNLKKNLYKDAAPEMADLARAALIEDVKVLEREEVPTKLVRNIMSGKLCRIPVDTPRCCDPSTELYWSM